jgi:hypothetical protein
MLTKFLVGNPEGKRPFGTYWRRWCYNIKMNLKDVGCDNVEWIQLAQDRAKWLAVVNTVMNLRVP